MKALLAGLVIALLLAAPGAARGGPTPPLVHVYVVVPTSYSSTVTPAQAVDFVHAALGSPADTPCINSHSCSVNAWFRHELGEVFDYDVTVFPVPWGVFDSTDACGSTDGGGWYWQVAWSLQGAGVDLSTRSRAAVVLMGGGGWAGHFSPANHVDAHMGMAGDWGTMRMFDSMNACAANYFSTLPANDAACGFAHEFAGMMGEFVTAGYNEGGLFQGDPMSTNEKKDLVRYSGKWLRSP